MRHSTLISLLTLVAMLLSATAHAQKVVTEGSGSTIRAIIDASGIPHTTVKKAQTTQATNTRPVPVDDLTDLASQKSNERVYKKFEVSKEDNSSYITWKGAIDLCAGLTYNNSTGWRLPTQRELMLIWVLYNDLKALGNSVFTPFIVYYYWSSTETSKGGSPYMHFRTGYTKSISKADYYRVRCVRDI